jgi:hypothetical protein
VASAVALARTSDTTASIRTAAKLPERLNLDGPFTIDCGGARICIYAKKQSRLTADKKKRKVEFAILQEVVIHEFTNKPTAPQSALA